MRNINFNPARYKVITFTNLIDAANGFSKIKSRQQQIIKHPIDGNNKITNPAQL